MRYSLVFLILATLALAMPVKHAVPGKPRDRMISHVMPAGVRTDLALPSAGELFSAETQANADAAMKKLRSMPPAHQFLFVLQAMVLTICSACLISYVLHSLGSLAGFSITLTLLTLFVGLLVFGMLTGGKKPRILTWLEKYTEMGPFIRRMKARGWERRFARNARVHKRQYQQMELARVRVRAR